MTIKSHEEAKIAAKLGGIYTNILPQFSEMLINFATQLKESNANVSQSLAEKSDGKTISQNFIQ